MMVLVVMISNNSRSYRRLTLHFVHMMSAENGGATIEIRDGSDENANLIKIVEVRNYTRPESIYTTGNNMYIIFR